MSDNDLREKRPEGFDLPQTSGKEPEGWNQSWRWWGYGIELLAVVGLFTGGGWWMDRKIASAPCCMVGGFFIGFVGMVYLLFKETAKWRK